MKIFMMLRTRDEERNIARFCSKYPPENVDKILISDGYSVDKTLEIAKQFPNTHFRPFMEKVYGDNEIWRQPEGRHFNFISSWAYEEGVDDETWLGWADCDSYPTEPLVRDFRYLFEEADQQGKVGISIYYIYMWGKDQYFPRANLPGPILYFWKAKCHVTWDNAVEWGVVPYNQPPKERLFPLVNPYALMHDFTPTPEITEKKWKFYRDNGKMTDGIRPVYELFGPSVPLEDWMH